MLVSIDYHGNVAKKMRITTQTAPLPANRSLKLYCVRTAESDGTTERTISVSIFKEAVLSFGVARLRPTARIGLFRSDLAAADVTDQTGVAANISFDSLAAKKMLRIFRLCAQPIEET